LLNFVKKLIILLDYDWEDVWVKGGDGDAAAFNIVVALLDESLENRTQADEENLVALERLKQINSHLL